MRVVTKLMKSEFRVGTIEVDGGRLLIRNSPEDPMPVKVYLEDEDAIRIVRAGINGPVLRWTLRLPWLMARGTWKNRQPKQEEAL